MAWTFHNGMIENSTTTVQVIRVHAKTFTPAMSPRVGRTAGHALSVRVHYVFVVDSIQAEVVSGPTTRLRTVTKACRPFIAWEKANVANLEELYSRRHWTE